jgi:alkenylglycerophosphocholine/alkenylglycerophosphoethanolamine hydrolase
MTNPTAPAAARKTAFTLLFIVAGLVAMSHLANEWVKLEGPAGDAWKASGIVLLGLYALSQRAWIAGAGLLFCALGDVLLEHVFVYGMVAFAIGHLFYIAAFAEWGRVLGLNKRDFPVVILVLIVSAALLLWLISGMGDLLIPALLYQAIITVMVCAAFVAKAPMLARLGAVMFMLSDTLIAAGRFADADIPPGSVWVTYALAQIMIAWGMSRIAPFRDHAKRKAASATA